MSEKGLHFFRNQWSCVSLHEPVLKFLFSIDGDVLTTHCNLVLTFYLGVNEVHSSPSWPSLSKYNNGFPSIMESCLSAITNHLKHKAVLFCSFLVSVHLFVEGFDKSGDVSVSLLCRLYCFFHVSWLSS
jgi:hypothetical protein